MYRFARYGASVCVNVTKCEVLRCIGSNEHAVIERGHDMQSELHLATPDDLFG